MRMPSRGGYRSAPDVSPPLRTESPFEVPVPLAPEVGRLVSLWIRAPPWAVSDMPPIAEPVSVAPVVGTAVSVVAPPRMVPVSVPPRVPAPSRRSPLHAPSAMAAREAKIQEVHFIFGLTSMNADRLHTLTTPHQAT